jgi:hypothetical protein
VSSAAFGDKTVRGIKPYEAICKAWQNLRAIEVRDAAVEVDAGPHQQPRRIGQDAISFSSDGGASPSRREGSQVDDMTHAQRGDRTELLLARLT